MTNGDAKTAHAHGNLKLRVNDDSYGVWPYCHQHVQWCAATVQHLQSQCHSSQNGPTRQLGHLVCECQSRAMFSLSQRSPRSHTSTRCVRSPCRLWIDYSGCISQKPNMHTYIPVRCTHVEAQTTVNNYYAYRVNEYYSMYQTAALLWRHRHSSDNRSTHVVKHIGPKVLIEPTHVLKRFAQNSSYHL